MLATHHSVTQGTINDTAVLATRDDLRVATAELVAAGTEWLERMCRWQRYLEGEPGLLSGYEVEEAKKDISLTSLLTPAICARVHLSGYKKAAERAVREQT